MTLEQTLTQTLNDEDLLALASEWAKAGRKVALAIVIKTWGSAPRALGSLMIIREDGFFEGSVSGGCVEGEVIFEAENSLKNNKPKHLKYSVSNQMAWEVGLACGGEIEIFITPLADSSIIEMDKTIKDIKDEKTTCLKIHLKTGEIKSLKVNEISSLEKACTHISVQKFYLFFSPPIHLYIIGAVHISQALISFSHALNYKITVIDPRGLFAQKERFKGVHLIEDWPDNILNLEEFNDKTALVTLTHDPKIDDAALKIALPSKAFYIGSLGSKKTHASRLKRLRDEGVSSNQLDRIHAPIGMNIGSKTPAEIALSIISEIEGVRTGKLE